jgi:hypothetical protein
MSNSDKSRRSFFASLLNGRKGIPELNFEETAEKVKMLTADGKLVEVDKATLEKISGKQKASNSEIYDWMNNPSKK